MTVTGAGTGAATDTGTGADATRGRPRTIITADPELKRELQEEADRVLGPEFDLSQETAFQRFTPEHLTQLVKHKHTLDETLRMRPPVPGLIDRDVCGSHSFSFQKTKNY